MTRTRHLGIPLAVTTVLSLTGCAGPVTWPAQDLEGLPVPSIVWPEGTPELDDERIATVINAEVTIAAANNAHDYSSPALRTYATEDYIARYAELSQGTAIDPESPYSDVPYYYVAGPAPVKIEAVRDTDTGAEVDACVSGWSYPWMANETGLDPVAELGEHKTGVRHTYELLRSTDGTLVVADSYGVGECSTNNIKYGTFDPQPEYGSIVYAEEFTQPDGTVGLPPLKYPYCCQQTPAPTDSPTHTNN
jgi:hypothetical protein